MMAEEPWEICACMNLHRVVLIIAPSSPKMSTKSSSCAMRNAIGLSTIMTPRNLCTMVIIQNVKYFKTRCYLNLHFFKPIPVSLFICIEEEIKRLHQALDSENSYSQVGFNYDEEKKFGEDSQSPKPSEDSQEDDEPFVAQPELEVPETMTVVSFTSDNQVIIFFETCFYKTIYFVA